MPRQAATLRSFSAEDAATATGLSAMASCRFRLAREKGPDRQHIHLGSLETIDGFLRRAHDRLVLVETRVQDHRSPGFPAKGLDQIVIERVLFPRHGLQSPGVIDVVHGAQALPLLRTNLVHM